MFSPLSHLDFLQIPALKRACGQIRLPGSKSVTNRAWVLSALARGETRLLHPLWSDDTFYMMRALRGFGVEMRGAEGDSSVTVRGAGGKFPARDADVFVGNSGTTIRFLSAASALGNGGFSFSGIDRMKERPIQDLVDALRSVGAEIDYAEREGFPPIVVHGKGLRGGNLRIRGNVSSQYLTAVLLAAPCMENPLRVTVDGELISKPYVRMTLRMMGQFGVDVENRDFREFLVPNGGYASPGDYEVEGDASSASYALAAASVGEGTVRVLGVDGDSMQGDVQFAELLREMGAEVSYGNGFVECRRGEFPLRPIDLDLSAIPDAAMTAAVLCLFARGKSSIRGIRSWRVKETDRLNALACELRKAGADVFTTEDSISVEPPNRILPAAFETYDDHRMAMCMSLVAYGIREGESIRIHDPLCVAKTYPDYWKDLKSLSGGAFDIPQKR